MNKKTGRRRKRPTRFIFETQYYGIGKTAEEMAKKYEVNIQTIYNWANYYKKERENERNYN